jgi:ABC-type ATPase involved in cell division
VADATMAALGLTDTGRISGSLDPEEMRRLALAFAEMGAPEVVVLDDPWEMPETVEVVERATARGAAVLIAVEEPGLLGPLATRTLALEGGKPV